MGFWSPSYHTETNQGVAEGIDYGKSFLENTINNWKPLGKRLREQQKLLETNPEASMIGLGAKAMLATANKEAEANQVSTGDATLDAARLSKIKASNSLAAGTEALNRRESMWSQLANMRQQGRMAKLGAQQSMVQSIMGMYGQRDQIFQEQAWGPGLLSAGLGAAGAMLSGGFGAGGAFNKP